MATSAALPTPKPGQGPTVNGTAFQLVAFYYPGPCAAFPTGWTPWDTAYDAPMFGNFWPATVTITPPSSTTGPGTFNTGEAAFQATKWWQNDSIRTQFEQARTGGEAFALRKKYRHDQSNSDWAGFGQEPAMDAVIASKFSDLTLRAALLATKDAYLLEHNSNDDRDSFWSDNCNGDGQNLLGHALMRLRHSLAGTTMPTYPPVAKFTACVQGCLPCMHSNP